MKRKKALACLLAGVMTLSMAACGDEQESSDSGNIPSDTSETESFSEETEEPEKTDESSQVSETEEASIDFEDGGMDFIAPYNMLANSAELEFSVEDYQGSKALQVKNLDGNTPYVGIDVTSLLGENAEKVATIEMEVGVSYEDGTFNACSGKIYAWSGAELTESYDTWSVFLEEKNPNKAVAVLDAGEEFVNDAGNIIILSLETDNGLDAGKGNATMYVDNLRFLDSSGNLLAADSMVAFAAPKGFQKTGHDPNLMYVDNETVLEGFAVSAAGWAQDGIELTDEQRALLVPGAVITIYYKSESPVWLDAVGADNPKGNWLRGVDEETFEVDGYVATDNSAVQYTYEQLVPFFGEDFGQYVTKLQCESKSDWEVYSVSIGEKSAFVNLESATVLEGFAVSEAAWVQAGIELTDEQRSLLVPGAIIEISYKCESPVWLVAIGADNPKGSWLRGFDTETNEICGTVSPDNDMVQYTYEQLVPFFGEDFGQYVTKLQCESREDWEVYSVSIGFAE